MKKLFITISSLFFATTFSIISMAQNSSGGGLESVCSGVLYYAIGESSGAAKAKYQWAGLNYMKAGIKALGEQKFMQTYEYYKKSANATPNDQFWELANNCVTIAETQFKGK